MKLSWGAKVSDDFVRGVLDICGSFHWDGEHPSWLMACMAFESGETFSPKVKNSAGSGATGLIQFMPATARGLGTSTDKLAAMTAVQQLEFVKLYFKPYANRINSLSDMYMAILLPKYIGRPEDSVLFDEGEQYRQNAGLDANKDHRITKAEASAKVTAKLIRGLLPGNVRDVS